MKKRPLIYHEKRLPSSASGTISEKYPFSARFSAAISSEAAIYNEAMIKRS
jgi:hypothetical protein